MIKKDLVIIGLFSLLFVFSISMVVYEKLNNNMMVTGYATTGTTVSNVTISKFLSISMSDNLSAGILYGTVNTIPTSDQNATHNNDGAVSGSSMFVNVSTDSNTGVDFCIKANADLTDASGGNVLGIGNETYSNATTTNAGLPNASLQTQLSLSYAKAGEDVAIGNSLYYRFYLDIPAGTPSGTYNNTINFKGIENGTECDA